MTLTQILQKIRSAFYTKAETDTKLYGKSNIVDTVLKTNTDYTFRNYALNSLNIDEKYDESYAVAISEDGYGTRPVSGWTDVINFCTYHFITQLCIPINASKDTDCMYIRTRWSNDATWGEWRKSANDNSVVHKSGDETINGVKTFTSEIVNTSPHFRHIYGDYGTFWRQDGTNLYLLLTNSGDPYGGWNNFRPLTVNLATGVCDISGRASTSGYADNCGYSRLLATYADDGGHFLCPDRYDGWNTRLYMTYGDKSVKADSVHVHHADYAARSAGDGAFFISGYQIYVG